MQEGWPLRPPQTNRKRGLFYRLGIDQRRRALCRQADQPLKSARKKLITDQTVASDAVIDEAPQHREFS